MERPTDTRCGWSENALDFEMRTAFGKVMRTQDALEHITVRHMKDLQTDVTKVSLSDKQFVRDAFLCAVGAKGVQLCNLFPPSITFYTGTCKEPAQIST